MNNFKIFRGYWYNYNLLSPGVCVIENNPTFPFYTNFESIFLTEEISREIDRDIIRRIMTEQINNTEFKFGR